MIPRSCHQSPEVLNKINHFSQQKKVNCNHSQNESRVRDRQASRDRITSACVNIYNHLQAIVLIAHASGSKYWLLGHASCNGLVSPDTAEHAALYKPNGSVAKKSVIQYFICSSSINNSSKNTMAYTRLSMSLTLKIIKKNPLKQS